MQYTGAQENDLTIRANRDRAVDEGIAAHHVLPAATDEHAHVDRLKPVILDRPPALHIIQVDRIKGGALRHLFGLVEPARAIRAPKNATGGFRPGRRKCFVQRILIENRAGQKQLLGAPRAPRARSDRSSLCLKTILLFVTVTLRLVFTHKTIPGRKSVVYRN